MAMLTRYRLVNVEGLGALVTSVGTFRLDQIGDYEAEHLHAHGSRYVEPLPPAEPAPEPPAPAPEPPAPAPPKPATTRRKAR